MASSIPKPQEALQILAPISPEIYRAFEHGISKGFDYFRSERIEPKDPWAFAMIVKLHAREHLLSCPEFASVVMDRLSLCGISFRYQNWRIRLWRSAGRDNPKLPHPGRSESRREYYVQTSLFGDDEAPPELRLVILWDLDKDGKLGPLWLVCPKNFNQKTGEISVHWAAELPNPILGIESPTETPSVPALPYQAKKEQKKKEA